MEATSITARADAETKAEETPKSCGCVAEMNEALDATYPGLRLLTDVITGHPAIATYKVSGREKPIHVFPSFCPFCGIKYGV